MQWPSVEEGPEVPETKTISSAEWLALEGRERFARQQDPRVRWVVEPSEITHDQYQALAKVNAEAAFEHLKAGLVTDMPESVTSSREAQSQFNQFKNAMDAHAAYNRAKALSGKDDAFMSEREFYEKEGWSPPKVSVPEPPSSTGPDGKPKIPLEHWQDIYRQNPRHGANLLEQGRVDMPEHVASAIAANRASRAGIGASEDR